MHLRDRPTLKTFLDNSPKHVQISKEDREAELRSGLVQPLTGPSLRQS
jgi:hypothetical protein